MEDTIINVNTLPESLHNRFRSTRVRVREENGVVTLTPVNDTKKDVWGALEQLRLMLSDGRMSSENYMAQKQADKELDK